MISIAFNQDISSQQKSTAVIPGFLLGILYILCGILYILTEHNPTKKTVTMSLALSIVTILGAFVTIIIILSYLGTRQSYRYYDYLDDNMTDIEDPPSHYEHMKLTVEAISVFYNFVGTIIFIVMSTLAGAALRSTNSQAILVMSTKPAE
ncbi:hypothetical protein PAMP_018655 [Pampus punctatissimus]